MRFWCCGCSMLSIITVTDTGVTASLPFLISDTLSGCINSILIDPIAFGNASRHNRIFRKSNPHPSSAVDNTSHTIFSYQASISTSGAINITRPDPVTLLGITSAPNSVRKYSHHIMGSSTSPTRLGWIAHKRAHFTPTLYPVSLAQNHRASTFPLQKHRFPRLQSQCNKYIPRYATNPALASAPHSQTQASIHAHLKATRGQDTLYTEN